MDTELFEQLLQKPESSTLDFKRDLYDFTSSIEEERYGKLAKFIKDIVAFTNTIRSETSYIILGVEEQHGKKILHGITSHIDDASLQEKIKDKVHPKPQFTYYPFEYEGKQFGIIKIPVYKYFEPCKIAPCKNLKKMKGLELEKVYIRRGSSNQPATEHEIVQIYDWLRGLEIQETQPQSIVKESNRKGKTIVEKEIERIHPEKQDAFYISKALDSVQIHDMFFETYLTEHTETLFITLTLTNRTQKRFDLWLGASIVSGDWKEYSNAKQNKTIIVEPGECKYTRELSLPNNIPTGEHQLGCVIWAGERSKPDKSIKGRAKWSDIFYIVNSSEQKHPRVCLTGEDSEMGKATYLIQGCTPSPYGTEGKNRRYINGSVYLIEKKRNSPNNECQPGDYFRVRDSEIGRRYEAHYYGTGSKLGFPVSEETTVWNSKRDGNISAGSFQCFEGGNIYFSKGNGANAILSGDILKKFCDYEKQCTKETGETLTGGKLGFPRTGQYKEESRFNSSGTVQKFQYGCIITWKTGTYGVESGLYDVYSSIGLWKSELGFPKDDQIVFISNISKMKGALQHFENGCIVWNDEENKGFFIYGEIYEKWMQETRRAGFPLNTALVMGDYLMQHFEGGVIKVNNNNKNQIYFETEGLSQILTIEEAKRFIQKAAMSHEINIRDVQGSPDSEFNTKSYKARVTDGKGVLYCHADGKHKGETFYVKKGIGRFYEYVLDGASSKLGLPVSDEKKSNDSECSISLFEGGYIEWSPKTFIARAVIRTEQGDITLDEKKL